MPEWLTRAVHDPALRAALKALAVALIGLALPALDVALLDGQAGPAVARVVLAPFGS